MTGEFRVGNVSVSQDVRYWHLADMNAASENVRAWR
jgi:hypothetical protein